VHQCGAAQATPGTNYFTCPGFTQFCTQVPGTCPATQHLTCGVFRPF
jgi:hypothetical protein